jgi:predicted RNA-binding Zn ribbon-like protein
LPDIPKTVGNTYGDRMKHQRTNNPARNGAPVSRPVDQFDNRKNVDASNFAANASYKRNRRTTAGNAYKPSALHSFEKGMISNINRVNKNASTPSDEALVNFLDKVIAYKKTIQA